MVSIVKEDIDGLSALLKIKVPHADYEPKVNTVAKDYSKKLNIKGFRKGMVPLGVVKKMFGNEILAQEIDKIIQAELPKYLQDNNLNILAQPIPVEDENIKLEVNQNNDYEFTYELGIEPEFELKALSPKTKITKYTVIIDDKMLKEEMDNLRTRFGEQSQGDSVEPESILNVELIELKNANEPKEGGINHATVLPVDFFTKGSQKDIIGLKKEDSLVIKPLKAFDKDKDEIAKHILNIEEEELKNINSTFKLIIKNITNVKKAALNQDFYDKVYGKDAVKSETELKDKIKSELKVYLDEQSTKMLHSDMILKLIDETTIQLPEKFLKRWIKLSDENKKKNHDHKHDDHDHEHDHTPMTDEDIDKEYKNFERGLNWSLISKKIIKANDIKVEPEEIEAGLRVWIQQQLAQTGQAFPDEELDKLVENFKGNPEYTKNVIESVTDEKIFKNITETLTIKDKDVNLDKFKDLVKNIGKKPKNRFKIFG